MRISVEFDWNQLGEVTRTPVGRLAIPKVMETPGVYRFRVTTETVTEVYIGQASNLRRRMRNYSGTHTGDTNTRIRKVLLVHLSEGRSVLHAIAQQPTIAIDGELIDASFSLEHIRLIVENSALAFARRAGEHIHNIE